MDYFSDSEYCKFCIPCELFSCYLNGNSEEKVIDLRKYPDNCTKWLCNDGVCPHDVEIVAMIPKDEEIDVLVKDEDVKE